MSPNLLDLLDEVSAQGWLVNNLFQLDNATWQANLRDSTRFTQFGLGDTPADALAAALDAMTIARPPPAPVTWALGHAATSATPAPRPSLSDLLAGAIRHPPSANLHPAIIRR